MGKGYQMGKSNWRSFEEARSFVHKLQLKTGAEWREWAKTDYKPDDIPADPAGVYKNEGWVSWGDWLGTDVIASQNRVYRTFEEARNFVHQLKLNNQKEWKDWTKTDFKPDNIPTKPDRTYKDQGWNGYGDWLGTGTIAPFNRVYRPFQEARDFVRQFQLKNHQEWR